MDAISHAGSAIGILSPKEGVVLAAEKKVPVITPFVCTNLGTAHQQALGAHRE
jgi:hypothetical protein